MITGDAGIVYHLLVRVLGCALHMQKRTPISAGKGLGMIIVLMQNNARGLSFFTYRSQYVHV